MWSLSSIICNEDWEMEMFILWLINTLSLAQSVLLARLKDLVVSRCFNCLPTTLPSQNKVFNIPENKKQLLQIIVETLVTDATVHAVYQSKPAETGQDPPPTEISASGITMSRQDLKTVHKEADEIVVAQAIYAATEDGAAWRSCYRWPWCSDTAASLLQPVCHCQSHTSNSYPSGKRPYWQELL